MENGKSAFDMDETVTASEREAEDAVAAEEVAPEDVETTEIPATQLAETLAAQVAELNATILRLRADYDNFRKRAERERTEAFDYASMDVIRAILPVLDDFERALSAAPALEGPAADYAAGIELIYQRLLEALKKLGLEPIEASGKPFDPNLHHAVQKEHREDYEDHTVLEQYQRGYNFKGKLLRAAMVKVAVTP